MRKGQRKLHISKGVLYKLYIEDNLSLAELSKIYLVSPQTMSTYIKMCDIPIKKAVPRNQNGSNNNNWKGNKAGYAAFHYRVEKIRGKPEYCEHCKTTDKTKKYNWANILGKLHDVNDYKRLCKKCHNEFDGILDNRDSMGRFIKKECKQTRWILATL